MNTDNLITLLQKSDKNALITRDGKSLSFAQLYKRIGCFAGGLQKQGISAGDRILLLIPMSIELYIALLAIFWIGGTVVLVDLSAPLDQILKRYRPKAFIGSGKAHLLRVVKPSLRGLDLYVSTSFTPLWHRRMSALQAEPPPIAIPEHPALLTFTTGSTGTPKAIARSHQFLLDQHKALSHHMYFEENDVDLPTLPVFLLHSLAGGATCVLADADLSKVDSAIPEKIIAQIQRQNITSMSGSPAFFAPLVRHLQQSKTVLPQLQRVFTGGARVNAMILRGLCDAFPNADIFIVYGSTEAEPIAVLNGREHLSELEEGERSGKGALVGTPVEEIELWIDDDEIIVSGDHVNLGYYQDPDSDAQNKIHRNGKIWHRTGDAGYLDSQGRIWLLGRAKGKVAGYWPMPIEAQAESFTFVRKAGLAQLNGKPLLAVELENPPEGWKEKLKAICPNVLSVDAIPVDPRHNSKVLRSKLNELVKNKC